MKKILLSALVVISSSVFAQHDYEKALHLSTRYLGAQRSGDTKSWILPEGSGGAFGDDGEAVGKDLSGGWHDCGDYIKFHVTGPYAALTYLYGYDKYPEVYPDNYSQDYSKAPGNGIPDVLDEVKIETDYLIKCVDGNTIYWQVSDGREHNYFNEPLSSQNLPAFDGSTVRPVYSATEGHSNAMGAGAAALALMSIVYEPYDANYAQECLDAAIAYYDLGRINPANTTDATDFAYSFLANEQYNDEMGMGAAMLYRATGNNLYLQQAESYASAANPQSWTWFQYAEISHLLAYELYTITDNNQYLTTVGNKVNNMSLTNCGYFHQTNWGSLRDAGNAALLAALYHRETDNQAAYDFAKSNIDFILGSHGFISADAPANFSFLIGYDELNGGYPQSPHHSAAFGKSTNVWGQYGQERDNPGSVDYEYELTGALAGGPESACADFEDNIDNYVSSEYCMYYNSAFNSALAYIHKIENNIITSNESEIDNVQSVEVFPNPTTDFLQIKIAGTGDFELLNGNGQSVRSFQVFQFKSINVSNLPSGVYFLRELRTGWSTKVIVE